MAALVCDPVQAEALIRQRREMGGDRYDEVWDGLYIMSPLANPEHQWIVMQLTNILYSLIAEPGRGKVYPGANITDRQEDWEKNYRCPDVVVVLKESEQRCRNIGPAFLGGPDFLIEVRSPEDKTFEKIDFYGSIGVRELLIVDRDTRDVRLLRLSGVRLAEVEPNEGWLVSQVTGLAFRTHPPGKLEVRTALPPHRTWSI